MLSRRELISGGVAGLGAAPGAAPMSSSQRSDDKIQQEIASNIREIDSTLQRALLSNSLSHGSVDKIRDYMLIFCKSNQKFPDFMEVGLGVFIDLYDWHVKNRQQLVVQRGPDGRYWLQFMFTNMVLRPEVDNSYVGVPYDRA